MKTEAKIALGAFYFSIVGFLLNMAVTIYTDYLDEEKSKIKLNVIEILSNKDTTKIKIIEEVKKSYANLYFKYSDNEISQVIYELLKDKIIVFINDNKKYQVISTSPRHEWNLKPALKLFTIEYLQYNVKKTSKEILIAYNETDEVNISSNFMNGIIFELFNNNKIDINSTDNTIKYIRK